jgi:hypothetical protein
MRKLCGLLLFLLLVFLFVYQTSYSQQPEWVIGMRVGMSIASGGGGGGKVFNYNTWQWEDAGGGTKAGFQFGPTGEVIFNKQFAVVENLNINTQSGTPIEWGSYFKYYFQIPGSKIKPYADAGFSLWFVSGGPYVGIPFGGGALFPVAPNIYIPADAQFGPIFVTGSTVFGIEITTGIRFIL